MVNWNVTIDGTQVTDVFNVSYSEGETDKLGKATIECANNTNNRSFQSGDPITIQKNGTNDFTGYLTGKPTSAGSDPTIEIEAKDRRLELKYEQVGRVFYNVDTGQIIRDSLDKEIQPKNKTFIHKGNNLSGWSTNAHKLELGNISSQKLYESGNDFIFVGWSKGAGIGTSIYKVTFDNVPSAAIPGDGTIDRLVTRVLVNNRGSQFSVEVNLRDNYGNNYNWPIEVQGSDFNVYELRAEEANTEAQIGTALSTNGTLEYRFEIDGEIPEARAVAIDYAQTLPFEVNDRGTRLSASGVETTGRKITRRVDRSIFELIKELATEDGYISYTDTDDTLYYEQSGQTQADLSIDYSTTPVLDANFERDYENIVNKVIVQGSGNVRVSLEDGGSIQFYGISAREEPIVDESIQTRREAIERGRGYLDKNAWADVAFKFEIADSSYQKLKIGQDVQITWPPEDIDDVYAVSDIETDKDGIVTISFTDTSAL